ncbi:lamin tail domain-containing protein [Paraliomyxa miuraensis]|uniref:lamin tail domain-containing protein n=1 Tax=Paraliomyxa miuraensis TaxID=376150 RepID=UPI002254B041|nr:lamin tail domain-containing protein [Paraliomyxa miuraensis]MCX4241908.1 lamin tail domain-containing protein [Paraliomyxa miuraensis]
MVDVYERLWNADENGCRVSARAASGEWLDPAADVLLDVQRRAHGRRDIDLSTRPLFAKVEDAKLALPTYAAFIALLDNYVANAREPEHESPGERREIDAFLDAVCNTQVAAVARAHINDELGETLTEQQFRTVLDRLWFVDYTNHYGGRSVEFASGFEHVFVGEGMFDARVGGRALGEVSGYHSWIKFALDERAGRVDYLGMRFDLRGGDQPEHPDVVTLQMLWYLSDIHGRVIAQLFKKKGGFLVGPSPELELVSGAVAYYESIHGRFPRDRRETTIRGSRYELVLYRNITLQNTRGEHIRSFYPTYLGHENREPAVGRTEIVTIPAGGLRGGAVSIVRAGPNPRGGDRGEEWVELRNDTADPIDLAGWRLGDRMHRTEALEGTLAPGAIARVVLPGGEDGMQLGNRGGVIALYDPSTLVAAVRYGRTDEEEIVRFDDDADPEEFAALGAG